MRCKQWLLCAGVLLLAGALLWGAWQMIPSAETQPEPQPLWLLKDSGGRLAQYEYEHPETPVRTWPVYTALLPEADLDRLRSGIPVYSDEELRRLVEDFGG